ncbi:AMP-dependent synthetase/ligase [Mycobacterium paragordonae]|uniref:AMP-dependent synthetase/ligase n=1 Tax=Mycobacterium paragordonae TaxID=1389713 RepID=UPI0007EF28CE|nr:AMP-dependent synthetase [Mycobacterium gordonae]PJE25100.1 MAG: long-chain fatty acid--CoA ligase [Mycobacterium sp.]
MTVSSVTTSNLASMFFERVGASARKEAFRRLSGDRWVSVTWQETADRVRELAAALLASGIEPEQRVAIMSGTRYEWILADLAVMCAGAATTTVYPSTHASDATYIVADSESRIVFAEDAAQVAKLADNRGELPDVQLVVVIDGEGDGDWVITFDEFTRRGAAHLQEQPKCVEEAAATVTSESLATLIYTSGTTGRPKGVRLAHRSWTSAAGFIRNEGLLGEDDLHVLWLPLAHSFGKVLLASQLACGFVSAVDGRVDKIVENMGVVKPTFMAAVPRIFEKAHARIVMTSQGAGGIKARLFDQAFRVGLDVSRRRRDGKPVPLPLRLQQQLFDRLVFSKVREVFGGRLRFFVSGSAPLNREIAEWFLAAGVLVLEGYGLTESAGAGFINRPDNYKLGTVGLPFDGTDVRIGDNGEIQLHGPLVMTGYHHLPDKTEEAMTKDGWLRTGDRGSLDSDGFLTITGRIKELFKTSGGKYVAPPAIEAKFMALCPYASQFIVFGEARNYCVALIALDGEALTKWAQEQGISETSFAELTRNAQVREMVDGYVSQLNSELNRWETIKKWELIDHELSVDTGELTPSLKLKRAVVEQNNKKVIDEFYV